MDSNKRLSDYKIKKIMEYFCADIEASKTSLMLKINRNTINRYYNIFRELIYHHQEDERSRLIGDIKIDVLYLGDKKIKFKQDLKGKRKTKKPVFRIFEADNRVFTEILFDCTDEELEGRVLADGSLKLRAIGDSPTIAESPPSLTDKSSICSNVAVSEPVDKKIENTKEIESFWSFTKRRLAKFNGVNTNFDLHLKESEWRWKKNYNELQLDLNGLYKTYKKR